MLRDSVGAPGFTVVWSSEAPPSSPSSCSGIAQSLDMVQARLESVEEQLAGLDSTDAAGCTSGARVARDSAAGCGPDGRRTRRGPSPRGASPGRARPS